MLELFKMLLGLFKMSKINPEPEIEWLDDPTAYYKMGILKVQGTEEWAVVRAVQESLFGWTDPRVIYSNKLKGVTYKVLTVAPNREAAIGYAKLLKES
jgi:hypothetical protein